jgi:hypothetical protein
MKLIGYGGILRRFSAEAKKVQVEVLFAETWALGRAAIDVLGVRDGRTVSKSLLESIKGTLGPDAARQFVERVMEYDVILSGRGDVVGNTEGLADAVMRDTKNNPYTGGQIVMQFGKSPRKAHRHGSHAEHSCGSRDAFGLFDAWSTKGIFRRTQGWATIGLARISRGGLRERREVLTLHRSELRRVKPVTCSR